MLKLELIFLIITFCASCLAQTDTVFFNNGKKQPATIVYIESNNIAFKGINDSLYIFGKNIIDHIKYKSGRIEHFSHGEILDPRDNNIYNWKLLGDTKWFTENLNYNSEKSWCYGNEINNCEEYGRLYNWEESRNVCPQGWHLPTEAEWISFFDFIITEEGLTKERKENCKIIANQIKDEKHWNSETILNNKYGFSALPGGYRDIDEEFYDIGTVACFWTYSESDISNAKYYTISSESTEVNKYKIDKNSGFSVRCVSDK